MSVTLKTGADYSISMGDFDLSELPSAYISQYNSTTIVGYVGSVKVTIKAPGSPTAVTGDKMDLSDIDANSKSSGDQTFSFIGTSAFHGKAGELRFDTKSSDTFIYGDLNGDRIADFTIRVISAEILVGSCFIH